MSGRRITLKSDGQASDMTGTTVGLRIFDLLRLLLTRMRFIVGFTAAVAGVTVLVVLLVPNRYESRSTILPTGKSDKMAELKALAGLSGMMSSDANSSELFPNVLQSQRVRDAVLKRTYEFTHDGETRKVVLSDYYGLSNPDKLRAELAGHTGIHKDRKTGVITITFTSRYPELSRAVLDAYLADLEHFNLHKRRSRARENAEYLEQQVASKRKELTHAEQELEDFQKVNRDWASTTNPEILATLSRLQREVEVKNQTYLYLTQEYEIAKFEAQKDVPIVRILDPPSLPTVKSYPKRALTVSIATLMALILSIAFVLVREVMHQLATGREAESFDRLRGQIEREFPRTTRITRHLLRHNELLES